MYDDMVVWYTCCSSSQPKAPPISTYTHSHVRTINKSPQCGCVLAYRSRSSVRRSLVRSHCIAFSFGPQHTHKLNSGFGVGVWHVVVTQQAILRYAGGGAAAHTNMFRVWCLVMCAMMRYCVSPVGCYSSVLVLHFTHVYTTCIHVYTRVKRARVRLESL